MKYEGGLKLRTKLERARSLTFTNAQLVRGIMAGAMTKVGDTIGVVVENVGSARSQISDEFPNGPDGVLVYEADRIVLPKSKDEITIGQHLYYDSDNHCVSPLSHNQYTKCAIALEDVSASDKEVMVDLKVME